jgi:hypothetical protein
VAVLSDFMIQLLRMKMGLLLLQIEKYPIFNSFLVLLDTEACEWTKRAVLLTSSGSMMMTTSAELDSLLPGPPTGQKNTLPGTMVPYPAPQPLPVTSAAINSSTASLIIIMKNVYKEILLIRRLIAQIQIILMNLPTKDREINNHMIQTYCDRYQLIKNCFIDANTGTNTTVTSLTTANNTSPKVQFTWNDRKKYAEWINSICNVFAALPNVIQSISPPPPAPVSSNISASPLLGRKLNR